MEATNALGESTFEAFVPRQRSKDDSEFDITPMIDLVFMMNIYFLITWTGAAVGEIDMPTANHVAALDPATAVTITVLGGVDGRSVNVFIGAAAEGTPISDPTEQEERIAKYVEDAQAEGLTAVLIKAESRVLLREISRIAAAATIDGMTLHVGVTEKDTSP